ncbi:MAG TPA: phosphotransferase [Rhodothermales bacterium]
MTIAPTALESIAEPYRETAAGALRTAFGSAVPAQADPVSGGASGALIYRVLVDERWYLLRIETRADVMRNPYHYTCLARAAEAGVAPALHLLDVDRGVMIMDFLTNRPLTTFPGGAPALVHALGELAARLQSAPGFPEISYREMLERMTGSLQSSGLFAPGLLTPHVEALERIVQVYPWHADEIVASHNDPNPYNILFDGERLWLVDWETAYRNDPMTDVAIMTENFAPTEELEERLLASWRGRAPDEFLRSRLQVMRVLTRLYYAGLVLSPFALNSPASADQDVTPLTPEQLTASVAKGELRVGTPEFMYVFGKMLLGGFLTGTRERRFEQAMRVLGTG